MNHTQNGFTNNPQKIRHSLNVIRLGDNLERV